jgi:GT2 family glycosyltransferase
MRSPVIVLPVHNGAADVDRCLASLARWPDVAVVIVDDASTDTRIAPLLAAFAAARAQVRILSLPDNRGFVAASNRGAEAVDANADLLFLNSDTEVTAGALEEMRAALERRPGAMVCCPLSTNATFLSLPRYQQPNDVPDAWDAEEMSRHVRACAGELAALDIPTPVGFCMWVRREAWTRFGPFDEAYGLGYGEEDDFGQRVQAAGGVIVCAPRAFVYHRGGASFGDTPEVAERKRVNGRLLASRWPHYVERTRAWCQANPLRPLQEKLWDALLCAPERRAVQVMHVVARWEPPGGALRESILALCRATRRVANHTVLVPMPDRGAWLDAIDHEFEPGIRVVGLIDLPRRFAKFLAASPASVVHFHEHGVWEAMGMVDAARAAGRRILVTGETPAPEECVAAYHP